MDIGTLAKALWEAMPSGVIVPRVPGTLKDGAARENECHDNVRRWVAENPTDKHVMGWLVFDQRIVATLIGQEPHFDFLAHSIVEDARGNLTDITPVYSPAAKTYPFIRHPGGNDQFSAIMEAANCARVRILTGRDPVVATFYEQ